MESLLKEEILRITEMMEIQNPNKSDYKACQRFSGSPQKMLVCKKIMSLKSWLFRDSGLGLMKIIDQKKKNLETDIPENLKKKFVDGANFLHTIGKIDQKELDRFIERHVKKKKQVYIDGVWQPINKLNTNYYDLAELLTDMIYRGGERAKPTIQHIISDPEKGLLKLKPYIVRLIDNYFVNSEELNDYTKNTLGNTREGEAAEAKVKEVLEEFGFKTEYEGGNGDMIDMVYGTDLIMTSPKYGTKTIQVKNTEKSWNRSDKYEYVDWVVIANPFTIYDNKTKEKIEL